MYKGIIGRYDDSKWETLKGFLVCIFGCVLGILVGVGALTSNLTVAGSTFGACFASFTLIFLCSPFVLALGGLEYDGIYENGITNRNGYLFKRLTGKSFHRFENIIMIGYGQYEWMGKRKNFIMIFENHSFKPACGNFNDKKFKNDFYEQLVETLKVKCPNARWQKVDFFSLPRRQR